MNCHVKSFRTLSPIMVLGDHNQLYGLKITCVHRGFADNHLNLQAILFIGNKNA
jgi:hypothetical protein